jgi:hypothetical protein
MKIRSLNRRGGACYSLGSKLEGAVLNMVKPGGSLDEGQRLSQIL